jgi:hypothetical protein
MFARQNTPEAQKEVVPNKTPEEALTQSYVDPKTLFILLKANNAEINLPAR